MTRAAYAVARGRQETSCRRSRPRITGRQAGRLRSRQRTRVPQGRRRGHDAGAGGAEGDRARRHLRRPRAAEGHQQIHEGVGAGAGGPGIAGGGARYDVRTTARRIPTCAAFAEVEVDLETGKYHILDYLAVADVGTVIHPRALGGQVLGRSMLGIGHAIGQKWVYDQHYGLPLAKRFHHNKPPTILDAPVNMAVGRGGYSGSGNAGGRARYRRAAGGRRMHGDSERAFGRARRRCLPPRSGDGGHDSGFARSGPTDGGGRCRPTSRDRRRRRNMAIIRDIMPAFELFQPATIDDALRVAGPARLGRLGDGGRARQLRLAEGPHQATQGGDRSEPGRASCAASAR